MDRPIELMLKLHELLKDKQKLLNINALFPDASAAGYYSRIHSAAILFAKLNNLSPEKRAKALKKITFTPAEIELMQQKLQPLFEFLKLLYD
jgi:uncharacterized protein (UPF0332 family)